MKILSPPVFSGLSLTILLFTFFLSGGTGWGKSAPALDLHFEKVGLFPIDDRTQGALGPDLDRLIKVHIEDAIRFKILISELPPPSLPLRSRTVKNVARKHGLDGIISSFAELERGKVRMGIFLRRGDSGTVFAREFISFKNPERPGELEGAVKILVQKLLSRLPYNGWVLEVGERGRSVMVNSGLFHGLGNGAILDLFALSDIKTSPLTGEFISAEEEKIGKLKIVQAENFSSSARIVSLEKGRGISGGEFFRFMPSGEILSSVKEEKASILKKKEEEDIRPLEKSPLERPAKPRKSTKETVQTRGSLYVFAGPAWSRYTLSSSSFNLNRDTSAFPRFEAGGEFWVRPRLGLGGDLGLGLIKFDKIDSTSVDRSARLFSFALYFNFRLAEFFGDPASGLIGRLGFQKTQVKFSSTDSQFLTDTLYSGSLLGLELRLPIRQNLKTNIGVNYFPRLKIDESPVSSGEDPSSFGTDFYIDGKLRLTERIWFSLRYEYLGFLTDFSGTGARAGGITDAESKDLLHSFLIGFSYDF